MIIDIINAEKAFDELVKYKKLGEPSFFVLVT